MSLSGEADEKRVVLYQLHIPISIAGVMPCYQKCLLCRNSSGGGDQLREVFLFLLVSVCTMKQDGQDLFLESNPREHRSVAIRLSVCSFPPPPCEDTSSSTSFLCIIFSYDVSKTTGTKFSSSRI